MESSEVSRTEVSPFGFGERPFNPELKIPSSRSAQVGVQREALVLRTARRFTDGSEVGLAYCGEPKWFGSS